MIEAGGDRPDEVPSDAQLVAAGAHIGEIRIDPQNIFDTSRPEEQVRLFELANRLHIQTRDETIATQLLFQSGDSYDPHLLQETERYLRSARYLRDAEVVPVGWHDGLVDVKVETQDVWTLNPGISFGRAGGANNWGVQLEEMNLFGRGTQLALGYNSDVDRSTYGLSYKDRQLGSSWWGLGLALSQSSDGHHEELSLESPFHSLDTRRAGGIALLQDQRVESRYDLGEVVGQYGVQQHNYSVHGGWSNGLNHGAVLRWTTGFTWDENRFSAANADLPVSAVPADRRLAYPWVGIEFVQDQFHTTRNRNRIERTEDYALGWQAQLRLGYADSLFGADRSALMFAASAHRGLRFGERQNMEFDASVTGRLEGGEAAGTVASTALRYYYKTSRRNELYASAAVDAGFGMDADQQLQLGGDNGPRGYPLRYQSGTSRWLATVEDRFFTDWYPFRMFNVAAAAFFDAGATNGAVPYASPSLGLLKDVGVGLRIGNARSALGDMVHIDFAWPLDGPASIRGMQVVIQTKHNF